MTQSLADQMQATEAAITLIESLSVLVEIDTGASKGHAIGAGPLASSKLTLEKEIVSLIGRGDKEKIAKKGHLIAGCRSTAIIEALPDSGMLSTLDDDAVNVLLFWAEPADVELLVRKGIVPYGGMIRLLDRVPSTPEWDRVILEVISPVVLFPGKNRPRPYLIASKAVGQIRKRERLAAVIRAQCRHHPKSVSELLTGSLRKPYPYIFTPLILFFAGARLPNDKLPDGVAPELVEAAELMTSNHGILELTSQYGDLEEALATCKSVEEFEAAQPKARAPWRP